MPAPAAHLDLSLLDGDFAVCRLDSNGDAPLWALSASGFCSLTRTSDEWSVVCPEAVVPDGVVCEREWRLLQVAGPLDFSLTGILSSIAAPLAAAGISIFAVSTYDTDYLMVRAKCVRRAIDALESAGHRVRR